MNEIKAGAVITNVAKASDGGIVVTLSNGNTWTVPAGTNGTNGKDGKDGKDGKNGNDGADADVWTIGDDGFWYKNGEKTQYQAVGKDGANGDTIEWKVEDGKLVEYKNGEKTGNTLDLAANGAVTAVFDGKTLTLNGVVLADGTVGTYTITNGAVAPAALSLIDTYQGWYNWYNSAQGKQLTGSLWGDVNVSWDYDYVFLVDDSGEIVTDADGYPVYATDPASGQYIGYYYPNIDSGLYFEKYGPSIVFSNAIEKDNVFGKGLVNEMTFVAGTQVSNLDAFVVRVSPANYQLKAEDITFVNSQGDVLDQVEVLGVLPFTDMITRGDAATGLWEVYVYLPEYDAEDFYAATHFEYSKDRYTQTFFAAKAQEAVSTYDMTFNFADFTPSRSLDLFVGNSSINNYNNRYAGTYAPGQNPSLPQGGTTPYAEKIWANSTKDFPTPWTSAVKTEKGQNYLENVSDNRSGAPLYKAVLGETIPIAAVVYQGNNSYAPNANVVGMYVVYDYEANAIESAPSEWNAWKSYEANIAGLNTVFEGNTCAITINDKKADKDIIGFRVFAVNVDGTLLDPDGRAFYVQVGEPGAEIEGISTVMSTFKDYKAQRSAVTEVSAIDKMTAASYELNMDGCPATNPKLTLLNKKDQVLLDIAVSKSTKGNCNLDLSTIKKAYFTPVVDPDNDQLWKWVDGKTYTGTLTFKNANGFVIATIPVAFTKILPEDYPAGYSVKTNQIDSKGNYNCFLVPNIWAAEATAEEAPEDQFGKMEMKSVFNFPTDEEANFDICFGTSYYNEETEEDEDMWATGDGYIEIHHLPYIDNETKHTTTVSYNYGTISSALVVYNNDGTVKDVIDYAVDVDSFPTIYYCIYNEDSKLGFKWSWKNLTETEYKNAGFVASYWKKNAVVPALIYEDFTGKTIASNLIEGYSQWDSKYRGTVNGGYTVDGKKSLVIVGAKFVTATGNNAGLEEYYKVEVDGSNNFLFTAQSGATNPVDKVASKLIISVNDMYGHVHDIPMDANVIRR